MQKNQTFGQAVEALKQGKIVRRAYWDNMDLFVFRQVPSEVPVDVISRMTSLPSDVKEALVKRNKPLIYKNQFCIVYPDNTIHGWRPSGADILESDWIIHDTVIADETVGVAQPL
jgi:hypothetical protein